MFSKARLARLHDIMAGYVERGEVPGIVTAVSRHSETHVETLGAKAIGGDPITRDTIFRITSMTKPVTAVATMILVEECLLRLDEPVDRLIPELASRRVLTRLDAPLDDTVPAARPITTRDLLTFRMGFGSILAPPGTYPVQAAEAELFAGELTPDEWIARLGTLPLMYQPGEKWLYHTSADVLGVLIARASGRPFEKFLRERIFEPLGMDDTGYSTTSVDRLATSYWTDPETGALTLHDDASDSRWSRPPVFAAGGGTPSSCLVSTVDDYLAFATMLLNNGQHGTERILSRPSVETMTSNHLTAEQRATSGFTPTYFANRGWGFGVAVTTRRDNPSDPIGSYGWDGGLGTCWRNDPSEDMVTLLMTQAAWTSPFPPQVCDDFRTSAYQAIDD